MNKCTKKNCPMNAETLNPDCDLKGCPYRTEISGDLISREQAINELKLAYFDKNLQSAKDDPCIVDAMIDWVIRTIKRLPSVTPKSEWIPIKTRPMTEEEKEHFFEYADSRCDDTYTILDCPLPDDGQEVILSVNGYVDTDIFCRDSVDGCYFESYDIDDVDAWQPKPQPYKEGEQ